MNYPTEVCKSDTGGLEIIPPTMREKLLKRKERIQAEIEQIDATIKLMDETPNFERLHDAITKLRFL